ncbi:MAG: response regulator transcription factor [Spirochaetota bacterium]
MGTIIAIVEDDRDIRELVDMTLTKANFTVKPFANGDDFMRYLRTAIPACCILDLMLPDMSGIDICKSMRSDERTGNIPIIMLTAKSEESDKVLGLELGADDYMTKPFSTRELTARVKAVLRRRALAEEKNIVRTVDNITIDTEKFEVSAAGKRIELTTTEFKILDLLTERPGAVCSRNRILDHLWGNEKATTDRAVDVHIMNLRTKLGRVGDRIRNIRGVGYKFQ